jgi:ATP-dependent DNA helicase DinG
MRINIHTDLAKKRLIEMNLLKGNERVVFISKDCALIERSDIDKYKYSICNYMTGIRKLVSTRNSRVDAKKLLMLKDKFESMPFYDVTYPEGGKDLIYYIFNDIFSAYGYTVRKEQINLSQRMYESLKGNKIMLSDVAVGFGKTHAYLVAAIVHRANLDSHLPMIISTSSKRLQKSIAKEYLPEISKMLVENGVIDYSLKSVVRKGMQNYICKNRHGYYLETMDKDKKYPDEVEYLKSIHESEKIDLNEFDKLSSYDAKRICVKSQLCKKCKLRNECRYQQFLHNAQNGYHDFQICNHNYYLAESKNKRPKLLPEHEEVIFDEAHKIGGAALSIYGSELCKEQILKVLNKIKSTLKKTSNEKGLINLIDDANILVFEIFYNLKLKIEKGKQEHKNSKHLISFNFETHVDLEKLKELLEMINENISFERRALKSYFRKFDIAISNILNDNVISWLENSSVEAIKCAPANIGLVLFKDVYEKDRAVIMTSGTIAMKNNFDYFKRDVGLDLVCETKLQELSQESIFDYRNNSLLYQADDMPVPDYNDETYIAVIASRIKELVDASHGHALVLFTSYFHMDKIFHRLQSMGVNYPLFKANKKDDCTIDRFRNSVNGVLLGCGLFWEGIDFKGDLLSHLIIVKLPFLIPDPISEHQKNSIGDISFKRDVLIPQMLIKLKQGHGRAIRCETDTAVISILDSRADRHYRKDVYSALPQTKVTSNIEDVKQFFLDKKDASYFQKDEQKKII